MCRYNYCKAFLFKRRVNVIKKHPPSVFDIVVEVIHKYELRLVCSHFKVQDQTRPLITAKIRRFIHTQRRIIATTLPLTESVCKLEILTIDGKGWLAGQSHYTFPRAFDHFFDSQNLSRFELHNCIIESTSRIVCCTVSSLRDCITESSYNHYHHHHHDIHHNRIDMIIIRGRRRRRRRGNKPREHVDLHVNIFALFAYVTVYR